MRFILSIHGFRFLLSFRIRLFPFNALLLLLWLSPVNALGFGFGQARLGIIYVGPALGNVFLYLCTRLDFAPLGPKMAEVSSFNDASALTMIPSRNATHSRESMI